MAEIYAKYSINQYLFINYNGVLTIIEGKFIFRKGPLTKRMEQGNEYIVDEFYITPKFFMRVIILIKLKFDKNINFF